MSLHVVAVITAKPGSEDAVRAAMQGLVEPTRGEDGCISYSLSESSTAPGTFVTVEEWNDPADLDQHMRNRAHPALPQPVEVSAASGRSRRTHRKPNSLARRVPQATRSRFRPPLADC